MAEKIDSERKQLITFLKYFALKSAQVIVQSRNGVKVVSSAKQSGSRDKRQDWFNLAIPDNEKVSILTKNAMNGETIIALKQMLCIDIFIQFPEGDEHLLETWTLELCEKDVEQIKDPNEVYHRMEIMLKSLLSITRLQPAYKLARRQEGEPYVLTYRVFCGNPQYERLGSLVKTINVCKLALPMGTMNWTVKYITDLAIGPNRKVKPADIMVQSDHFKDSPRKDINEKKIDLNKPLSIGAFVDKVKIDELHKALQENLPPEPPMAWVLSQLKESPEEDKKEVSSAKATGCTHGECSTNAKSEAIAMPKKKYSEDQMYSKKLEFPFADGSPITELANFYRECLTARSQSDEWCDVAEELQDLSMESLNNQLKAFENAVPEFDNMVASMFSNSSDNE